MIWVALSITDNSAADQLTDDPALKPSDVVKEGDTIKVYVVGVNDA